MEPHPEKNMQIWAKTPLNSLKINNCRNWDSTNPEIRKIPEKWHL